MTCNCILRKGNKSLDSPKAKEQDGCGEDRPYGRPRWGCALIPVGRQFVHLAYMDDSGTRDKKNPYQVMGALVVEDKQFLYLEVRSNLIAESIIPESRREEFEEFHAHELYGGRGVFEGISQEERFGAIKVLLEGVQRSNAVLMYGAVDKFKLEKGIYATADPVQICFRRCMEGVEEWVAKQENQNLVLLIVDDCDKSAKKSFRESFRRLRKPLKQVIFPPGQAWHFHDDMYFGDSRESIGIQTADLCAFFIAKHLKGGDPAAEGFYAIIKDRIVHSKLEPEHE